MVAVSLASHVEFGPTDDRLYAPHFRMAHFLNHMVSPFRIRHFCCFIPASSVARIVLPFPGLTAGQPNRSRPKEPRILTRR